MNRPLRSHALGVVPGDPDMAGRWCQFSFIRDFVTLDRILVQ